MDNGLAYGPCVFVDGAGHNWWQSATGEYAYAEVPCATPGDGPAVPFARDLVQRLRLPDLRIRVSPNPGLVAVPARFWIDDYQGQALSHSGQLELPPLVGPEVPIGLPPAGYPADCPCRQPTVLTVDVQAWPLGYRWTFGDGRADGRAPGPAVVTGSLGRAAVPRDPRQPLQPGEIAHTYEFASFYTGGGVPVEVEAAFAAAYRVDGGEWLSLGETLTRRSVLRHRVQEIQSVLVMPDSVGIGRTR